MAENGHGTKNESHACPICFKPFGRKDLRDRHRRRCEKSIGKAKQVKKKACERCIASKVKCGYEKPSCGRCLSRSVACEYKLEPQIRMPASHALGLRLVTAPPEAPSGFARSHNTDDNELHGLVPSSGADTTGVFSLTAESESPLLARQPMAQDSSANYLWLPHASDPALQHREDTDDFRIHTAGSDITSIGNASTLDMALMADDRWMPDLLDPALFSHQNSKESDLPGLPRSLTDSLSVSDIFGQMVEPQQHHNGHFSLENSNLASSASSSSCSTSASEAPSPASSVLASAAKRRRISPLARDDFTDRSLTSPLHVHCRHKSIGDDLSGAGSLSELVKRSPAYQAPLHPGMISLEEALKMTAEYPLRLLSPTFSSPFIHPRLCRQSPRGMPEPIAVALACVGMKLHSEQSGLGFVCDIFRDQRDKLIKELPTLSNSHEKVCATLHAMCIYQIEGLLSEKRYSSKLATAVLHHEYLVRATRRLLQKAQTPSSDQTATTFLSHPFTSGIDWDTWAVQESLRRSIFLLVIIHQLLGITKTLDPAYFEPLLPIDVFESIALPCGDALWMAESEEDWLEARRAQLEEGTGDKPLKLGEAVQRHRHGGNGDPGGNDGDWSLAQLSELTRLIISVASASVDKY